MFAQCPNDLVAIFAAREVSRKGQAIEVWRGDRLIYRVGPRWDGVEKQAAARRKFFTSARWAARLFTLAANIIVLQQSQRARRG